MRRPETVARVLLALGAASGGGAFVAGKLAIADVPPATVALLRYAIAAVMFAALLAAEGRPWPRPTRREWALLAGMGLSAVAGYNLLFLQALRLAPAAEGGLIVPGSVPVVLMLLSALVLRERPHPRSLAGIGVATVSEVCSST